MKVFKNVLISGIVVVWIRWMTQNYIAKSVQLLKVGPRIGRVWIVLRQSWSLSNRSSRWLLISKMFQFLPKVSGWFGEFFLLRLTSSGDFSEWIRSSFWFILKVLILWINFWNYLCRFLALTIFVTNAIQVIWGSFVARRELNAYILIRLIISHCKEYKCYIVLFKYLKKN